MRDARTFSMWHARLGWKLAIFYWCTMARFTYNEPPLVLEEHNLVELYNKDNMRHRGASSSHARQPSNSKLIFTIKIFLTKKTKQDIGAM